MKKFIYPVLGLAIAFSVQSCMDNYKAKYIDEKTLVDDGGTTLIKNGYEGGLTEIKASQLAATNSQNADVKSFAQMMITDHSKANKTLDSLERGSILLFRCFLVADWN